MLPENLNLISIPAFCWRSVENFAEHRQANRRKCKKRLQCGWLNVLPVAQDGCCLFDGQKNIGRLSVCAKPVESFGWKGFKSFRIDRERHTVRYSM